MQHATLETEFSTDRLTRKLADMGFACRLSETHPCRVLVVTSAGQLDPLTDVVVDFIFSDWQSGYLDMRLGYDHPYLGQEDREYVRLLAAHSFRTRPDEILDLDMADIRLRTRESVRQVLQRSGTVNIRGLLRFRARDYLQALDHAATDMVERFLADREYEEFVSMLRVMLEAQPPSMQTLHVFCTDERVWICDASGSLVRDEEISSAASQVSDADNVNAEDLTMSILIMRSPCRIIIHDLTTMAAWPSFAETVERVFLDRAAHCESCSTCDRLRRGMTSPLENCQDMPVTRLEDLGSPSDGFQA